MHKVKLKPGQILQVALIGEGIVEGELAVVSSDRAFIRMCNVRDLATNAQHRNQFYYSSEIQKIQIVKEVTVSSVSNAQSQPALTTKQLPNHVLDSALKKIDDCVFINQTGAEYHNVMDHLQYQRNFGVFMECIENGRHIKSPSLLSFVTRDWIYIFDLKSLEMTQDVSNLLSCDSYNRVIHNGRIMQEVLQHSYGTVLGRCFDIKVALIAIDKAEGKLDEDSAIKSENSIQQCVEKFLKVPEKFFDKDVDFEERPLKNESKLAAAKNVAFLLDLQDHIVHEMLLENFYVSCEMYADSMAQNADLVDSLKDMILDEKPVLRAISPFSLAMDVELVKRNEEEEKS